MASGATMKAWVAEGEQSVITTRWEWPSSGMRMVAEVVGVAVQAKALDCSWVRVVVSTTTMRRMPWESATRHFT